MGVRARDYFGVTETRLAGDPSTTLALLVDWIPRLASQGQGAPEDPRCAARPAFRHLGCAPGEHADPRQVPRDLDKPWTLISKQPFAGDTRVSLIYVPGKPEPLLMTGSASDGKQRPQGGEG